MRINALFLSDWKGVDAAVEVGHLNLFLGPNGSGKSARLLGLAWAITGETPIGALAETAAAYADDDGCQVGITLDDGFGWTRSLARDTKKGGMKHGIEIPTKPNLKISEAISLVSQHVGDFAPQFDLGKFLDLSDDKRRAFALSLCAKVAGSVTKSQMLALTQMACLKGKLGEEAVRIAESLCDAEQLSEKLLAQLDEKYLAALSKHVKLLEELPTAGDQTTAVGMAIDLAAELANNAKRSRDNAQKAARKLAEDKAALVTVAKTMQQLEGERDKLKNDREALIKQIEHQKGRASAKGSLETGLEKKRTKLTKAKEALEKVSGEEIPDAETATSLREAAEQLKADAAQASIAPELNERWTAALTADTKLAGVQQNLQHKLKFAKEDAKRRADMQNTVANNSWVKVGGLIAKLKPMAEEMSQRFLGVLQIMHAMSKIVDMETRNLDTQKVESLLKEAEQKVKDLEAEIVDCGKKVTESKANVDKVRAEVTEQQGKVNNARKREQNLENERQSMLMQALKIEEQIAKHGRQVIEAQTAVTNAEQDVQEATESLEALRREGGFVDDTELREQVTRLEAQQAEIETLINAKKRFQAIEAELQKCVADGEAEDLSHEAGKDLVAALKSVREALMVEVVKPLLSKIDRFLAAACPGRTSYCELVSERNKPIFDLGWVTESARRISLSAMSGGEEALFGAALSYALVSLADVPLKVLLLEAAEIDQKHLHMVLTGCEEIADELSNVFVATYLQPETVSQKWHVEHMEMQPA